MIGCIPRSPSPAVEISDDEASNPSAASVGADSSDVNREVQDLRVSAMRGFPLPIHNSLTWE